jgi:hypothetical protein
MLRGSSATTLMPSASSRAAARVEVASSTRSGLSATTASMLGSSPPPTRGSDAMLAGQLE